MQTVLHSWGSGEGSKPWPPDHREDSWSTLFLKCPAWTPAEDGLLVIAPHPNDEIIGAGGLMRSWAARGLPVNVLAVSDGEAAEPKLEGLATLRRGEVREALRKLSPTHVSVTRLGLPDGRIAERLNRLHNALWSLCRERLTLIAPYEHDEHPDNGRVGALCMDFARAHEIPIARYVIPSRLSHMPESRAPGPGQVRWVKFPLSDDAKRAKGRAMQCLRSQSEPLAETAYEIFAL